MKIILKRVSRFEARVAIAVGKWMQRDSTRERERDRDRFDFVLWRRFWKAKKALCALWISSMHNKVYE